jgi:iron(III) transport system substrate-binding protein
MCEVRIHRKLAALLIGAALVFCESARHALAADAAILEGARREAKLVIYTGVERAAAQSMLDAFAKKYPFISTQEVRASSSKLATRLDAEIEANRVGGDVFEFSLPYLTTSLQQRGEILQYDSPEYAHYAKPYVEPGYWAATGLSSIIILLNSRRVDAANVPKSLWDLTKPLWRNKLTIDNLEVSGTGYHWLVDVVNDQRLGWKYIEELGKNKPTLERGHAGMAQKVAAGEYFAAVEMTDFHLRNLRNASPNVPLLGVWPSEGVSREPWTAGILKRAQHPNAAKLYLDFLLSREGQELYVRQMGWTSPRSDVESPGFKEMPAQLKTISAEMSPDEALRVRDSYVEKWKQLWNLGGRK